MTPTEEQEKRLARVIWDFNESVRDNEITNVEAVTVLCALFTSFLNDVERDYGVKAREGGVLQMSRVLSRMMGARVVIVERKRGSE